MEKETMTVRPEEVKTELDVKVEVVEEEEQEPSEEGNQNLEDGMRFKRPKESLTFEDVAVVFSKDKWNALQESEKDLYREVIRENYESMIALGFEIPDHCLELFDRDEDCDSGSSNETGQLQRNEENLSDTEDILTFVVQDEDTPLRDSLQRTVTANQQPPARKAGNASTVFVCEQTRKRGRPVTLLPEEAKRRKLERDRARQKKLINLGKAAERWIQLKQAHNFEKDEDLAFFLLEIYRSSKEKAAQPGP